MKKKILFLIPTLSGGGAEKALFTLVNSLNPEKYEIVVQTILSRGVYEEKLAEHVQLKSIVKLKNRILRKVESYLVQFVLSPKFVYRHLIKDNYDIEIAYLEGTPVKLLAASDNAKARKYTWVHIDLFNYYIGKKAFRNIQDNIECYKKYDKIFCVSEDVRAAFYQRFGYLDNVDVQYNILDDIYIREKSKEPLNISKGQYPILVSVGRLCHQKGFERLINVVYRLKKNGLKCELFILGEGEEKNKLQFLIKQYDLGEYVHLIGFMKNPYNYMKMADIFVCSSYAEGFSTVATEALILGKAIVTTECSGMKELLGNSDYGIITENSDEGLYNGIYSVLSSPQKIKYYSQRALDRSKIFTKENRICEYEHILDDSKPGGTNSE